MNYFGNNMTKKEKSNKEGKTKFPFTELNKIINNNNILNKDTIDVEENNVAINYEKEKKNKRLDILKLLDEDNLSKQFIYNSPLNGNDLFQIPYSEKFYDNNIENESIFYYCIGDDGKNDEKSKNLNLEDIKDLKKNKIFLFFGDNPCDAYYQIKTSNKKDKNSKLKKFSNYICNLNKFITKDPHIVLKENKIIFDYGNDNCSLYNKNEYKSSKQNKKIDNSNITNENTNNLMISDINSSENIINNNLNNNGDSKNKICMLRKPTLIENYDFSSNITLMKPIIINKYKNNSNDNNIDLIKKDMCNKYQINYKDKEKVNEKGLIGGLLGAFYMNY